MSSFAGYSRSRRARFRRSDALQGAPRSHGDGLMQVVVAWSRSYARVVLQTQAEQRGERWLTRGVAGIGGASLLSDLGHEIPTSLLPSFLTSTLGAPAAALGLIEGVADGCAGVARFGGGALADDPERRRRAAIGGYTATAVLSSLIGVTTAAWQVGALRAAAWSSRGLRVPARNALLADVVPPAAYGRAYGFERAMDNLRRDRRTAARDRTGRARRHPRRDARQRRSRPARHRRDPLRDPSDTAADRAGKRLSNPALIADGNHARVDGFVSLGVVVGAALVALATPAPTDRRSRDYPGHPQNHLGLLAHRQHNRARRTGRASPSLATESTRSAGSHQGRTAMQSATKRGYQRVAQPAPLSRIRMNRPPPHVHGKEGVDGSSPSEGSAKVPQNGLSVSNRFASP
jgi:hypothetical protein